MEEEDKKDKKTLSRKWIVTIWALTVGTVIVGISGFCVIAERDIPDGFIGLATLLFTTGIAYIGGNVWQKQIYARKEQ
jgi:ABC-type xylose transport system permease subunit